MLFEQTPGCLRRVNAGEVDALSAMSAAYHAIEHIAMPAAVRRAALAQLLSDPRHGEAWFVVRDGETLGYVIVTYVFSIEFGGLSACLDELYLVETARGQGLGGAALSEVSGHLAQRGLCALTLEVASGNRPALALYEKAGFDLRGGYRTLVRRFETTGTSDPHA